MAQPDSQIVTGRTDSVRSGQSVCSRRLLPNRPRISSAWVRARRSNMKVKKLFVLTVVSGGFLLALGISCIPNIGGTAFQDLFNF